VAIYNFLRNIFLFLKTLQNYHTEFLTGTVFKWMPTVSIIGVKWYILEMDKYNGEVYAAVDSSLAYIRNDKLLPN
jgi:hypothetical protein